MRAEAMAWSLFRTLNDFRIASGCFAERSECSEQKKEEIRTNRNENEQLLLQTYKCFPTSPCPSSTRGSRVIHFNVKTGIRAVNIASQGFQAFPRLRICISLDFMQLYELRQMANTSE